MMSASEGGWGYGKTHEVREDARILEQKPVPNGGGGQKYEYFADVIYGCFLRGDLEGVAQRLLF